MELRSCFEFS